MIIHGAWHSPRHFQLLINALSKRGYDTVAPLLPSVRGNPKVDLYDDAKAVQSGLKRLIERNEKEVVVVMHSYGGMVGTEAIEKFLSRSERQKRGLNGGVVSLFYMTAFLGPKGSSLLPPGVQFQPFINIQVCERALNNERG